MIITIDGPSGTGKSTVAKAVAKKLGYVFFDTGAMYRSFAWKVLQERISFEDEAAIRSLLSGFHFDIKTSPSGEKQYLVDGRDISALIRTQEISQAASKISTYPCVRKNLVKVQRMFGHQANAVFEGRDMGTVVFPDADLKVFLTARPEVRAQRRYRELVMKFPDLLCSEEEILREIKERDEADTTRAVSPLRQALDAVLIDTSNSSIEQVVSQIVALHARRLAASSSRMHLLYRVVYSIARAFFKLCFRLKIYGLSHVRPGSAVIAANHASFYDPPVISISCPEEVHFLARETLFQIPILGRLIKALNSHPVSRDSSDAHIFRELISLLQRGEKVILFPEGSRSTDGNLQPLERGLSFLVYKAQCGILPVYVDGTFQAWPRGRRFPRLFGRIRCVFGTPLEWEEFEGIGKREAMEEITRRTHESIARLKQWLEEGAQGEPP